MPDDPRIANHRTHSAEIRSRLPHPVVDGDGHAIEFGPVFLEYLKKVGGQKIVDAHLAKQKGGWNFMSPEERRRKRVLRPSAWTVPARNTLDRATAMLPRLFRARMDDFGLDFAVVYSTLALQISREADEELRRASCRALNTMLADMLRDQSDRMTPVAAIPAHTPQEALDELDYAVKTLGFKAVMVTSLVRRPIPEVAEKAPELARFAYWMDALTLDSAYDYDPVWAKCVELKVAVTAHSGANGYDGRNSSTHYVYNHINQFAAGMEIFAKGLVLSGVTQRYPTLNFAFLEGGVAWATVLYHALVGHWEKRHPGVIGNYDERNVDRKMLFDLFQQYGPEFVALTQGADDPAFGAWAGGANWDKDRTPEQELANLNLTKPEDFRPLFEPNFYFGCEADDPMTRLAFDGKFNPFGSKLKAVFSSDVGHWDVPDMEEVLEEAYEMVEDKHINDDDFRDFVFTNPVMLHAGMNPDFFKGTIVEDDVTKLLATKR
jgi:predicted TIM-barrel fold metal-dependent hydrolase